MLYRFFAFSRFRKPARSYSCTLPCSGSYYDCQISSEMLSAGQLGRNLVTLRCWLFANKRFLLWKTWPWSRSQNHRNPSQVFTRPEAFNRRRFLCSIRDIRQRTSPRQICCHHRGHSLSPQASLMDVKQSHSLDKRSHKQLSQKNVEMVDSCWGSQQARFWTKSLGFAPGLRSDPPWATTNRCAEGPTAEPVSLASRQKDV